MKKLRICSEAAILRTGETCPGEQWNPQDYCSVAQDLDLIYSKLLHGGMAVLHGGADADSMLVCKARGMSLRQVAFSCAHA